MGKIAVTTFKAPAALGPYSQAVSMQNTIYLSGQIPLDPISMELVSTDFGQQVKQVFLNLQAVCHAALGDLKHIVKLTIYLTDLNNFPQVNELMLAYFTEPYPARSTVGVSSLPKGAAIEVEGIMVLDSI